MRDLHGLGEAAGAPEAAGEGRAPETAAAEAEVGRALRRLLAAPVEERARWAPTVAAALGEERFQQVIEATREQVGEVTGVESTAAGLVLRGPRGTALAWGVTAADGTLAGFLIGGPAPARHRARPRGPSWWGLLLPLAALAAVVTGCWTSGSADGWASWALCAALALVGFEGYGAAASVPWWIRRPFQAGALLAAVSACRLPELPGPRWGGAAVLPVALGAALAVALVRLVRARRHRWGAPLSAPLRFPFATGRWYVVQGGGPGINHHATVAEQRGALDLVRLGPVGFRTRSAGRFAADVPEAYAAYGSALLAPCDGLVVRAVDGIPDQAPGEPRFGPPYGNCVVIDTGQETVHLAHLRPGSVRVAVGERVTAGQLLGEVGNSGHSTEPHLHIHAEREGLGLDLAFTGVPGRLRRGRSLRTGGPTDDARPSAARPSAARPPAPGRGSPADPGPADDRRRPREPGGPRGGVDGCVRTARQCACPDSLRRLTEFTISSSASARPTQCAPSTDLPGSRSL
ncbi:M23 family metallopeptidase [Streptacidiphilus sp. PB12-B1b]|nr:M23 family metallopeptidase [Streptacidiphilus sp. PB12-B1b]